MSARGTTDRYAQDNQRLADALALLRAGGGARERGVRQLFEAYAGQLRRYFVRHRVLEAEAEELVQEVFIRVLRGCDSYRGEAPPAVWFWTIARNTMISYHRAQRPEQRAADFDDADGFEQWLENQPGADSPAWLRECLQRQLARFEVDHPQRAECITAVVMRDWGIDELAAFLGRSLAATKEYLSQCRKKLRAYLDECADEEGGYGLR